MNTFAISDLHLSLRGGGLWKPMDRFGEHWKDHHLRIAEDWRARVQDDDLVLLPGDLSWALRPDGAAEDLAWLDPLPGRKVIIKGNHDYWMPSSRSKLRGALPPSVQCIQNDSLLVEDVLLIGSRLWNIPGLRFDIAWRETEDTEIEPDEAKDPEQDARILARELQRLRLSVEHARKMWEGRTVRMTVCLTHFPPVDFTGRSSEAADIIRDAGADVCVFGHLHNLKPGPPGVDVDGVRYICASCDYTDFRLVAVTG